MLQAPLVYNSRACLGMVGEKMGQANGRCGWAAASSSFQLPRLKGCLAQPVGVKAPEQKAEEALLTSPSVTPANSDHLHAINLHFDSTFLILLLLRKTPV